MRRRGGSVDAIKQRVRDILLERREPMERISRELIRKETLDRVELDQLVARDAARVADAVVLSRSRTSSSVI